MAAPETAAPILNPNQSQAQERSLRYNVLVLANHVDAKPEDVVARCEAYLAFVKGTTSDA